MHVYYIIQVGPDFTWNYTNPIVWSDLETSIAVVCACLPTLRPVVKFGFNVLGSIRQKSHSNDSESAHELRNVPPEGIHANPSRAAKRGKHFENLDEGLDKEYPVLSR